MQALELADGVLGVAGEQRRVRACVANCSCQPLVGRENRDVELIEDLARPGKFAAVGEDLGEEGARHHPHPERSALGRGRVGAVGVRFGAEQIARAVVDLGLEP